MTDCHRDRLRQGEVVTWRETTNFNCKMEVLENEEYTMVQLFRKQYFQLLEIPLLTFPPPEVLIKPETQTNIFESMFNEENLQHPPPANYRVRVLKELLIRLENAIADPEEDV